MSLYRCWQYPADKHGFVDSRPLPRTLPYRPMRKLRRRASAAQGAENFRSAELGPSRVSAFLLAHRGDSGALRANGPHRVGRRGDRRPPWRIRTTSSRFNCSSNSRPRWPMSAGKKSCAQHADLLFDFHSRVFRPVGWIPPFERSAPAAGSHGTIRHAICEQGKRHLDSR